MFNTRRVVAAAALAAAATLTFGASAANAAVDPGATAGMTWYAIDEDGGLVNVADNNVGPLQACHNDVPVNVIGVQVPIDDVTGLLGIASDGNSASIVKTCNQESEQDN